MIGKAKSISHTVNAVNYAMKKPGAKEISRNKVAGVTPREIAREFRIFQNLNSKCQKNTFSMVLSPSIPDGDKLSNTDFAKLAGDFLKRMKLDDHQFISFLHTDEKHKHLHIFVNRIDFDGKAYKDHFISKKVQRIAESVAKEWGFTTAKEIQQQKEQRLGNYIKEVHQRVLAVMPRDINDYAQLMEEYEIQTHRRVASDGKVVGLKFQIGEETIKGSSVGRELSAANLQKQILQNYEMIYRAEREKQRRQQQQNRPSRDFGISY